ncbi:MAG: protein-L-isoaspartate(D-aspartate) O-methyltransferase [Atribacterota bacterium]|nr:protein-L-isoaspartate(D-aspartate) O-methyltransferase [Atribacterota bacterium]
MKRIITIFIISILIFPIVNNASVLSQEIEESIFTQRRKKMVTEQLVARDITDPLVLAAMEKVPRHKFVDDRVKDEAYNDYPLGIGEGQTISQPYIVALMTQLLELTGEEKVLEIGTGSGYQAAILAEIVKEVYTIEIYESLSLKAQELLNRLGYDNIKFKIGDGYYGWEEEAPFDAIIVTCAPDHVPPPLLEQLHPEHGRMVIPVGSVWMIQTLMKIYMKDGKRVSEGITGVRFVPMIRSIK